MREYPKTENLFTRNPETHKLNVGDLRITEHAQIAHWLVTEKVDGTNIRVILSVQEDHIRIDVRGRSDRASLPKDLETSIYEQLVSREKEVRVFLEELHGLNPDVTTCLYGEGYGAGIQKVGKQYGATKKLRIFDVTTTFEDGPRGWRPWETVERASELTGFSTVPVIGKTMTLDEIVELVNDTPDSVVAKEENYGIAVPAEGIVARTDPYLFTWQRNRVMFKLKGHDLP